MKKIYICTLFILMMNLICAQDNDECLGFVSDGTCLRYTASGYQNVINGNHSKAINESRKMANISAECELSRMINSVVSRLAVRLAKNNVNYSELNIDTTLVSSYKVFSGMKTICQSETKLINNAYVTYVTKEISLENIGDIFYFDDKTKEELKKIME